MEQVVTPKFRLLIIRHGESVGNVDLSLHNTIADSALELTQKGKLQAEGAGKFVNAFFRQPEFLEEYEVLKQQRLELIEARKEYITKNPDFARAFPKLAVIPRELPKDPHIRLWYSPFKRTQQTRDGILKNAGGVISDCIEQPFIYEQLFGLQDGEPNPEVLNILKQVLEHQDRLTEQGGKHFSQKLMGESRAQVEQRMIPFFNSLHRDAENGDMYNHVIVTHGLTSRIMAKAWMKYDIETSTAEQNPGNCHIRFIHGHRRDEKQDHGWIYTGQPSQIAELEAKIGRGR